MDVDDLFRLLGNPGRYQVIIYIMLCCNYYPVVINHLAMAIYGARTAYKCVIPTNSPATNYSSGNYSDGSLAQIVTPDTCHIDYTDPATNVTITEKCTSWNFELSDREVNIVSEWSLVCDEAYLTSLATTIYFSGVMVGGLIFGSLSDRWGRKPFILLTMYLHIIVGTALAFVHNYTLFVLLRFLQGILMQGLQTSTFVLIMELFTPEHRTAVGTIFEVFWGTGVMWLAFLSYMLGNWRHIQLAITLPSIITVIYIWTIPESVRWLVAKHRFKDAENVLLKAAKINGVTLPEDPLKAKKKCLEEIGRQASVMSTRYTIFDIFRMKELCKRSLILFYIWMVVAVGYYGLSLSITALSGNTYLNLFIAGLVELPAYCAAVFILSRFGRRRPLAVYLFIGGVFCLTAGLMPRQTASGTDLRLVATALAMLGRFGMAGCFSVILLYSCELYPTVIRNVSMGACAFWARVGGILAPQIIYLGHFTWDWLPVVIFGAVSLLGGFLTLLLPETLHTALPDTLEQAEDLNKKQQVPKTRTMSIRSMGPEDLIEESVQTETFI